MSKKNDYTVERTKEKWEAARKDAEEYFTMSSEVNYIPKKTYTVVIPKEELVVGTEITLTIKVK